MSKKRLNERMWSSRLEVRRSLFRHVYPMYTQVLFAFERVKELAPQHPEWRATPEEIGARGARLAPVLRALRR